MQTSLRLGLSLLILRLGVFLVMLMWTLGKFVQPAHAAGIFSHFYRLPLASHWLVYLLAAIELLLLLAFVTGYRRRFSYAAVLVLHAASTFASYRQYLAPFAGEDLLFFAAWPMLAACVTLYLLRDQDVLWALKPAAINQPGGV